MTKQQTPLAKSIQRKIDRVKRIKEILESEEKDLRTKTVLEVETYILEKEVIKDKNILPEERENMIRTYADGRQRALGYHSPKPELAEKYFNENYTQEIQEG